MAKLILMLFGIACSTSTWLQINKIVKTKSTKDFEIWNWIITEVKLIVFLLLAILEGNMFISINFGYAVFNNSIMLYLIQKYKGEQ